MDKTGKEIIKDIINIIYEEDLRDSVVFIENYDIKIASYLVQGVDVWLNNPQRPREASGTSGMKASANGALNLSILDGWWDEAYEMNQNIGWAIGRGEEHYESTEEQNDIESKELYYLLEHDVIPTFYNRGQNGVPRDWMNMMKTNMKVVGPFFNTNRMVRSYLKDYYLPAYENWQKTSNDGGITAKKIIEWRERLLKNWDVVEILSVDAPLQNITSIGETLKVEASVNIGKLKSEELFVQLYFGVVDNNGKLKNAEAIPMAVERTNAGGELVFSAKCKLDATGQYGYSVRVLPHHPFIDAPLQMGFIKWYKAKK